MGVGVFNERDPIFRQIADRIRADVLSGALKGEDQLMSTNQYASFYGINPATAGKAFQHLIDERIIYKKRGVGMFVRPDAREKLQADLRARFVTDVLDPMIDQARAIDMPLSEVIAYLETRDKTSEDGGNGQ